jgi:hypothetical protein
MIRGASRGPRSPPRSRNNKPKKGRSITLLFDRVSSRAVQPSAAESIENQCRAAVRAELKGPNCRMANPRSNSLQLDPCGIPTTGSQMTLYTDKVIQCVARGGPGRAAR